MRRGTTQSIAKGYSTLMTSTRIFSETCGLQKTTKQSCTHTKEKIGKLRHRFQNFG